MFSEFIENYIDEKVIKIFKVKERIINNRGIQSIIKYNENGDIVEFIDKNKMTKHVYEYDDKNLITRHMLTTPYFSSSHSYYYDNKSRLTVTTLNGEPHKTTQYTDTDKGYIILEENDDQSITSVNENGTVTNFVFDKHTSMTDTVEHRNHQLTFSRTYGKDGIVMYSLYNYFEELPHLIKMGIRFKTKTTLPREDDGIYKILDIVYNIYDKYGELNHDIINNELIDANICDCIHIHEFVITTNVKNTKVYCKKVYGPNNYSSKDIVYMYDEKYRLICTNEDAEGFINYQYDDNDNIINIKSNEAEVKLNIKEVDENGNPTNIICIHSLGMVDILIVSDNCISVASLINDDIVHSETMSRY